MRRVFTNKISQIHSLKIQKHVLWNIYADLTADSMPDQNTKIDERLRQSILGEDPNLVVDLKVLNKGRPNDTFKVFFAALEKKFQEIVATDDRSAVCNLINQVRVVYKSQNHKMSQNVTQITKCVQLVLLSQVSALCYLHLHHAKYM